jgi:hypothetical protein
MCTILLERAERAQGQLVGRQGVAGLCLFSEQRAGPSKLDATRSRHLEWTMSSSFLTTSSQPSRSPCSGSRKRKP